jgi:hypothetical protein
MKIWRPRIAKLVLTLSSATSLPNRCSGEVTGDDALSSLLRMRNRSSSVLPRIAIVVPFASFVRYYTEPSTADQKRLIAPGRHTRRQKSADQQSLRISGRGSNRMSASIAAGRFRRRESLPCFRHLTRAPERPQTRSRTRSSRGRTPECPPLLDTGLRPTLADRRVGYNETASR